MDRLRTAQIQIDLFVTSRLNQGRLNMSEIKLLGELREAKEIIGKVEAAYIVSQVSLELRALPQELLDKLKELGGPHEPNTE